MERAVEVALALEQAMERRVTMVVETKSVQLMDDLIPDDEVSEAVDERMKPSLPCSIKTILIFKESHLPSPECPVSLSS